MRSVEGRSEWMEGILIGSGEQQTVEVDLEVGERKRQASF